MGSPSVGRVQNKNLNLKFLRNVHLLTHHFSSFTKHAATATVKHFAVNSAQFIASVDLVSVS